MEEEELVLDDLGDGAGGAVVEALTASDAVLLVSHYRGLVAELQGVSGAYVNAHAAADALIGIDNRMGHDVSIRRGTPRAGARSFVVCEYTNPLQECKNNFWTFLQSP